MRAGKVGVRKRNMSSNQFGLLREIYEQGGSVSRQSLRICKDSALWSLLYRGYLRRTASDYVVFSPTGQEAFDNYYSARMPERKQEAELTERSQSLLRVSRLKANKLKGAA